MSIGIVVLTKDYLQFSAGEHIPCIEEKVSSLVVMRTAKRFHIPKSHARLNASFVSTAPLTPTNAYPWEDTAPNPPTDPLGDILSPNTIKPVERSPLGDNQAYLTDFTEGALPESKVDHVITYYKHDHFPEEVRSFIPKIKSNFIWTPDLLESLIMGSTLNERVFLVGMPGTGKTTAHEQYAAILRQPFFAVNGKDSMEASSFLGSLGQDGGGVWSWHDGTCPMCMKNGFYLAIDEVMKIPPGIQMALQTVWQKNGNLVLDDKPGTLIEKLVVPSPDFKIMASDNSRGLGDNFSMFGATMAQDSSTLDRFGIVQEVDYLDPLAEQKLLEDDFPEVEPSVIRKLVQIANLIRAGYKDEEFSLVLSLRGLYATCGMITQSIAPHIAFFKGYTASLSDESQVEAVGAFVVTAKL